MSFPPGDLLSECEVRNLVKKAYRMWEEQANVEFVQVDSWLKADTLINFVNGKF